MLITTLIIILISNAVSANQYKSVLYSRLSIISLLSISFVIFNGLYIKPLENGIGLYNGLFNISLLNQSFTIFVLVLASIIAILTSFYSRKIYGVNKSGNTINGKVNNYISLYLNQNNFQFTIIEYSLITLFILSGAILLINVGDLLSLFLSIELQSYGLYIISTIFRNSESATSSGLTYFLLGGLSSCFILLGSAILYVNSGTTILDNIYVLNSINELSTLNGETLNYINFSFIILTVGLLFKISAAPFHFWSPDVYDGIPTVVTTFVATIAKISLLILMLELLSHCDISSYGLDENIESNGLISSVNGSEKYSWKNILVLSSLMSLLIGSLLGLTQYRIKRLFAYSTISHVGFILLALCINKIESIQGYIFYILQYSISNLNAFFILITIGYVLYEYVHKSNLREKLGSNKSNAYNDNVDKYIDVENSPVQLLSQIKGLFYINSFLSISFAITLFSFVGIPPLIGFFAKQMVLSAALDEGYVFMTLVAIITSVIGAAYYLNLVKLIFFSKSDYVKNNAIENEISNILKPNQNEVKDAYKSKENEEYNNMSILISDKLSITISSLTMIILLFIFMPDEWFRVVNILSLSINNH